MYRQETDVCVRDTLLHTGQFHMSTSCFQTTRSKTLCVRCVSTGQRGAFRRCYRGLGLLQTLRMLLGFIVTLPRFHFKLTGAHENKPQLQIKPLSVDCFQMHCKNTKSSCQLMSVQLLDRVSKYICTLGKKTKLTLK